MRERIGDDVRAATIAGRERPTFRTIPERTLISPRGWSNSKPVLRGLQTELFVPPMKA
jgi:hypothetical protein